MVATVLAVAAAVAAAALPAAGRRHADATGHATAPASTATTTHATSPPPSSTSTTVPATTTTTAPAVPPPPYPVGIATVTVTAGGASLPTTVRYPARTSGTGATPLRPAGGWPLIVFSQGYAISPAAYSLLLGSWAREGYVVAAPSYPYTTPGAGPLDEADIVHHPAELAAVVAALSHPGGVLAGTVDAGRVGLVGHSDGGDVTDAAVNNTCCRIGGVRAAVILSGAELTSFPGSYEPDAAVPLLVVQGDEDPINPPGCGQQIYDAQTGARYYLDLLGAGHHSPYLDPADLAAFRDPDLARAPAYRRVVDAVTLAFWQRYLAGTTHTTASIESAAADPGLAALTAGPAVPILGGCPGAPSDP